MKKKLDGDNIKNGIAGEFEDEELLKMMKDIAENDEFPAEEISESNKALVDIFANLALLIF